MQADQFITLFTEFHKAVIDKLDTLSKVQQKQTYVLWVILAKLGSSTINTAQTVQIDEQELFMPEPMKTLPEIDAFERRLHENPKFRAKVVEILKKLGGHNIKQSVRLMLDRLVHDDLQAQFSYSGKRGKYIFAAYSGIISAMQSKHFYYLM